MESIDPNNQPTPTDALETPKGGAIPSPLPSEPVLERLRLRTKTKTVYIPSSPPQAASAFSGKPKAAPPSPPPAKPTTAAVAPKLEPLPQPATDAVQATARTAKITLVLDPASFTHLDSIGKKVMPLEVTVAGQFRLNGTINSKSYRKVLTQIEEFGVENCALILQGGMSQLGQLESIGIVVQDRRPKAASEAAATPEGETPPPPPAE